MTDTSAAANKELLRQFYKQVFCDWNMTMVDEFMSPDFISHDWPEGGPIGPQAFRDFYAMIRSVAPDARYEVDDLIAEGNKVVVQWRMLGTHQGRFRGIDPTGRAVVLKGIAIYRVEDGKLKERWVVSDLDAVLEQIRGSPSK